MAETGRVTSELLWRATLIAVLIDAPLLAFVARWVSPELFGKLKWYLAGAAFGVYAMLWGTVGSVYFWGAVYGTIFPAWSRWLLPLAFGLLFAGFAIVFWRLSMITTRWRALWFTLLGGLVSLLGHSIGISQGLLQVPMLSDASVVSTLVFGVFEFTFYWCVIVGLGVGGRRLGMRMRQKNF